MHMFRKKLLRGTFYAGHRRKQVSNTYLEFLRQRVKLGPPFRFYEKLEDFLFNANFQMKQGTLKKELNLKTGVSDQKS